MNSRILLCLLTLGVPTLLTGAAYAENKPPGRPPAGKEGPGRPPEKREHEHTAPTISSVSADSITVKEAKGERTFKITPSTTIELKGQKVKPDELKAGMRVNVTMGYDATVASRISANDPPKEEADGDKPGERGKGDERGKSGAPGRGGEKKPGDKK